jgi:hypothetical protein
LFEFQGLFHPVGVLRVDALVPPVAVPLLEHQLIFLLPTLCDRSIEAEGDSVVINWDSCWVKKIVKQGDKFQKQALARNPHRSPMREGPGAGAEG